MRPAFGCQLVNRAAWTGVSEDRPMGSTVPARRKSAPLARDRGGAGRSDKGHMATPPRKAQPASAWAES